MAGKGIYSCILFFAVIVLTGNQQCQGQEQGRHFVLVHGAAHGAWCWYKLQTLLEAANHSVTAIDMAASGIDQISLEKLYTFVEYTQPLLDLMESIPENETIILVGHSLGGLNLAFAMEQYTQKIDFVVFLTAYMPDTVHNASYLLDQQSERYGTGLFLDSQIESFGSPEDNLTLTIFGPQFISMSLYPLSPPEDVMLAKSLLRPYSPFTSSLANRGSFSNETYGSVKRAFILIKGDQTNPEEFQRFMIKNAGAALVKEIEGADHMAMISQPEKIYQSLLDIASYFSQK